MSKPAPTLLTKVLRARISALEKSAPVSLPKRPTTAYVLFTKQNYSKDAPLVENAKKLAGQWRALPEQEKQNYRNTFTSQLKQYKNKVEAWQAALSPKQIFDFNLKTTLQAKLKGEKVSKRQLIPYPNAPKRPLSATALFISEHLKDTKKELPTPQRMKEVVARWKTLSTFEKKSYEDRALQNKERYIKEKKAFLEESGLEDLKRKAAEQAAQFARTLKPKKKVVKKPKVAKKKVSKKKTAKKPKAAKKKTVSKKKTA